MSDPTDKRGIADEVHAATTALNAVVLRAAHAGLVVTLDITPEHGLSSPAVPLVTADVYQPLRPSEGG